MRLIYALAVLLAAFVAAGIIVERRMSGDSRRMLSTLTRVERDLEQGRIKPARVRLNQLESIWAGTEKTWSLITDHQEMDQVRLAIDRAEEFLASGALPQARAELSSLRFLIQHIPEKENLGLESVL